LTAGIGKMNFLKFSMSDLLACTISTIFFFSLYYTFGESVLDYVKKGNLIIFIIAALIISGLGIKKMKKNKKEKLSPKI
jgi:membrane protein DedA with SNARE-associated domain